MNKQANKINIRLLLLFCLLFGIQNRSQAQTTLAAGDILFTSYTGIAASGTPDTFSIVVLTPISSGTVIYFTDRGYQGGPWQGSGTTEGTISWTTGSALAIGQEVEIAGLGASAAKVNGVPNGTVAVVLGGNATSGLSLSDAGDEIMAFQGGSGDPTSGAATYICGINWALSCGSTSIAGWNGAGCTYGPQTSAMPPGLTGGTNAFLAGIAGATPNNNHGKFDCVGTPYSSVASLKAAIMNVNNWVFGSGALVTIHNVPPGCFYYATCTNPTITSNPPNRTICVNGNTTFTASATGATAYQWQVNTGSGFTDIANGAPYSGATTTTLTITGATGSMNGYLYRCRAIDGGCFTNTNSGTLTISNITSSTAQNNVACFGQSTGSASVSPTGGIGSYTYSWSPSGGTGPIATGLAAGAYTVTITDAISCQITRNFTITQPPALNLTASSQTNVACNGGANGAATVNAASGGAGGYTYDWTPGNPTGDGTVSVTGLTAQTYTCTVTDANGCTATRSFTITQPPALNLTASSLTNVACNGGATGAASVNAATGGAGGYTYNWTPGNPTGDGTTSITGLTAGTWTCTVTDANACTSSVNFTVTQPTAISLTASSQTNIACNGGANGAAAVNVATGGAGGYTYNWTPGNPTGDGTVSVTGLTAGTWTCTVTDANACTNAVNFTITQPTALNLTASSQTNVACNGGANGAASVNAATGGAGGYTYNWTPGNPIGDGTVSVTGLTAGTWTCTVTDANACTASVNFTVTQPPSLSLTPASQTNIACNGGATGAASVNAATGGAGGYTYNWTPGNPIGDGTVSVTGLTAGTWTCTVTDANACTSSVNFTVTQPATGVSGTTVVTNVACFGGNTGAINLTPTGGAGPYTFNWVSGPTTEDRTSLTAGTYSVTITDANACTGTVNVTVTQPAAAVSGTTVVTNVACFGNNTGAINLTPTGGVGPYTFNWGGGVTSEDRTSLTAGTYSVTITDANACTGTVNVTVTQPAAAVSGTTVVTNVACFGGNTGAINLTPTGGVGPYTFNWGGGVTSEDRTTLTAGTYSVTITDANGCTGTVNATLTQPTTAVSGTTVVTNVACFGGNTGAINLTPTGGVGPYTFNWVSGPTTEDRTTLTAGTYSVTITDANACTGTVNVTVTQPTAPVSGTTVVTNVACFGGNTGAINLTPTGGVGPYTFDWGGGVTSEDRTTLTAGTYTVTITDANACTGTVNVTVTQPTAPVSGTTVVTNVACFGGNTGAINLTPTGGVGPYTFDWGSGVTSEDRTTLTAGTYSVTITDANACTGTVNVTVTQPTSAVSGTTVVTDVSCFGGSNGTINLTPTGGVGPYTFNWVSGPTTEDRTGLTAGTYSVTITDANGCTGTVNATVTQSTAISATAAAQTNVACNGGSNGAASINTPTGGTPGYTYDWTPGTPTGDGTTSITGLTAGTYTVTVTDANGCTATQSFTITEPSAISFTAAAQTNVACFGGNTGALTVNPATGGTGAFTYDWTPGTPTGDGTTSITGLTAGAYSVTATDVNGCTATVSFTITQPPVLAITGASQTEVSCNGGSNGTATVTATGGTTGYTYSWAPSGGTGATATGLTAGSYTATVTDANGCTATQSFVITEPTALDLSNNSQINVLCNGGSTGSATVTPTGGTGTYTYSWAPSGGTAATATGLAAGTYVVTVTDANNCQSTQAFTITESAPITSSFSHTACASYTWGTQTHTTSGVYTQVFTDANGCDSTVTLTLTISPTLTNTVTESSCNSYTWAQNGMTYTTSGMYVDTIQSVDGCDSIVTLDLTITTPTSSSSSEFACGTYTWAQNGMTYTASGVYTDTIPNAVGCDSVITLNLTIGGFSSTQSESACGSYTWAQNGTMYTASGMYSDTLVDVNGCDSILILDLTINPAVIASATDNGNATITASAGTTYQWINCTTNTPIAGATAQTLTVTANGSYAVIVSDGTCSDTSNCVTITNVGIKENMISTISLHPNPTHDVVVVTMDASSAIVEVMDVQGKLIQTTQIKSGDLIDLGTYDRGVYTLRIKTELGTSIQRIVKN